MWNLEQNDNYVLSVDGSGFETGEVVNCISFNKVKGKVVSWLTNSGNRKSLQFDLSFPSDNKLRAGSR